MANQTIAARPVAWMRDTGLSLDEELAVISNRVRELWLRAKPEQVKRYTIPLYAGQTYAPDGWKIVPDVPTDEMCAAAMADAKARTVIIDGGPAKGATLIRDPHYFAYKAMLAAAPSLDSETA